MALYSLYCADVLLRNCSLTHSLMSIQGWGLGMGRFQFTDALWKRNKVQLRPLAARRREEIRTHPETQHKLQRLSHWMA